MKLGQTFMRGFVWKLAGLLAVLFFSYVGMGQARAECGLPEQTAVGNGNFVDQGQAYKACIASPPSVTEKIGTTSTYYILKLTSCNLIDPQFGLKYVPQYTSTTRYTKNVNNGECTIASGLTYSRGLGSGYSYTTHCTARQARNGGWMKAGSIVCDAGCEMTPAPLAEAKEKDDVKIGNDITSLLKTNWVPTGNGCGDSPATPPIGPPQGDYCLDLPMGHKICKNAQGKNCVISGKTGRKYCPTDGGPSVSPDRTEGATNAPGPAPGNKPSPRPGEEWTDGPSATTNNNKGSGCTSNCNNTNTTTVVSNAGNPNTTPGQEVPGDGSDNEGEGEEGEDNTSEGGATCTAPPVSTGDPLLAQIAHQTWMNRCRGDENDDGQPDWTEVEGDGDDGSEDPEKPHRTVGIGIGMLDESGMFGGSRACPTMGVLTTEKFGSFDLDEQPWMCDFVTMVNLFFKLIGAFIAFGILSGRNDA